jgi:hypothetical protein
MHLSIHATGGAGVPQAERHGVSGRNALPETETNASFGRTLLDKLGAYPEQTSARIGAAYEDAVAGSSSKESSDIERAAGSEPNAESQALISSKAISAETPAAARSARPAPLPESVEAAKAGRENASFPGNAAEKGVPESTESEANAESGQSSATARAGAKSVDESGHEQKTKSKTSTEPVSTETTVAGNSLRTPMEISGLNSVAAAWAGQQVQAPAASPTSVMRAGTGTKGVTGSGSLSAARQMLSAKSADSGASQASGVSAALAVEGRASAQGQAGAGKANSNVPGDVSDKGQGKAADKVQDGARSAGIEPGAPARSGKDKAAIAGGATTAAAGKTAFSIGSAANGSVSASQGHEGSVLPFTGVHSSESEVVTGRSTVQSSDPFHRLDQPTGVEVGTTVLHRGPQSVAVGVRDPALGWTEIHAESTAGQVSAVVATASTAAHASLASHLPSLTQFLTDHNVQVGSVTVEHGLRGGGDGYTGNAENGAGGGPGNGGTAQPGASQQEQAQTSAGRGAEAREMQTSAETGVGVVAGAAGSRVHVIA